MVLPYSTSIKSKYRSRLVYCGLVLIISLPLVPLQASPDLFCASKEEKPHDRSIDPAQADQPVRPLELGKPIEQELTGGQSHSYQITLAAGQYVKLVVEQRGIDVIVNLYGPDGKQITKFDSEIRTQGQETVSWVANEAGRYRLDVPAKYRNAVAGRYEIQVMDLRLATENDRGLYEVLKVNTEFLTLYNAGKYDEARPLAERALVISEMVLVRNTRISPNQSIILAVSTTSWVTMRSQSRCISVR
jgi:hypothetical protein